MFVANAKTIVKLSQVVLVILLPVCKVKRSNSKRRLNQRFNRPMAFQNVCVRVRIYSFAIYSSPVCLLSVYFVTDSSTCIPQLYPIVRASFERV